MFVPHFKMQENVYEGIKFLGFFSSFPYGHLLCFWSEAVTRKFSVKKVFLEILQNLKENTCARVSFFKKETLAQVFSGEFCKIFKNTFFTEHLGRLLHFYIIIYKRKKKGSIRISAYFSLFSLSSRKQRKRLFLKKKKFFGNIAY